MVNREREIRAVLRGERDKEIELVISKLEEEVHNIDCYELVRLAFLTQYECILSSICLTRPTHCVVHRLTHLILF